MAKNASRTEMANELDHEAARLAGVVEILEQISAASGVADALGVVRDTVANVNTKISAVAAQLR